MLYDKYYTLDIGKKYNYIGRMESWESDVTDNTGSYLIACYQFIDNTIVPTHLIITHVRSTSRRNDAHGASAWHIGAAKKNEQICKVLNMYMCKYS